MHINKINSQVNFKSSQDTEQNQIKKYTDEDLIRLAAWEPENRYSKVAKKTARTLLIAAPVVDSILAGAVHEGQLSSKLYKSAKTLGRWGTVFAAGFAIFGVKKVVNKNVEPLDKFNKNHALLAFGVDFTALYTLVSLLKDFGQKTFNKMQNLAPAVFEKASKLKLTTAEKINKSVINQKITKSANDYFSKHPHYNSAGKTLALLTVPAMAIAALVRLGNEAKSAADKTQNNYMHLKIIEAMVNNNEKADNNDSVKQD